MLIFIAHVTNGSNLITCPALLDKRLTDTFYPHGIVAKVANNCPDVIGRLLEYRTVVGFCHYFSPFKPHAISRSIPSPGVYKEAEAKTIRFLLFKLTQKLL